MSVNLTVNNYFTHYAIRPLSVDLSPRDQRIALLATTILSTISLGFFLLLSTLIYRPIQAQPAHQPAQVVQQHNYAGYYQTPPAPNLPLYDESLIPNPPGLPEYHNPYPSSSAFIDSNEIPSNPETLARIFPTLPNKTPEAATNPAPQQEEELPATPPAASLTDATDQAATPPPPAPLNETEEESDQEEEISFASSSASSSSVTDELEAIQFSNIRNEFLTAQRTSSVDQWVVYVAELRALAPTYPVIAQILADYDKGLYNQPLLTSYLTGCPL